MKSVEGCNNLHLIFCSYGRLEWCGRMERELIFEDAGSC